MNICIFGDSITWGATDYENGGWVERLKVYLMKSKDDIDVYNLGLSGDNSEELLKRITAEIEVRDPDIVIIAIGINDSQYIGSEDSPKTNLEKFRTNIIELTRIAKISTDKIIFIGLTKVDESKTMPISWDNKKYYNNKIISQYNNIIKLVCDKERITFIDILNLLSNSDLEDGLHPNINGHKKMFIVIRETIEKMINF